MNIIPTTHAKVIGLLGGMSWPSTITYYRKINEAVQKKLGGSHCARLLIWSDDYSTVERMQLSGEWARAADWLAESALRLEAAGADLLGIACNTMHKVSDEVRRRSSLQLVDMIEVASWTAAQRGCSRAAILGTRFTLGMGKYSEQLVKHGIEPIIPPSEDVELVDEIIYRELCLGIVSDDAKAAVKRVISRLASNGADGVVLACTELDLLVEEPSIGGATIVDAAQSHIDALVQASLENVCTSSPIKFGIRET